VIPLAPKPLAVQLRDHIKARAKVEGVGFDLPLSMFEQAVALGAKTFGVVHDGQRMIRDEQEPHPGFFRQTGDEVGG
jgi:hypothetical protein